MADPTDLIRAVDECEVRRLRDVLAAECQDTAAMRAAGVRSEYALAEANATIERVRALADEWMGDGANPRSFLKRIAGMALRRAIEGPAS